MFSGPEVIQKVVDIGRLGKSTGLCHVQDVYFGIVGVVRLVMESLYLLILSSILYWWRTNLLEKFN